MTTPPVTPEEKPTEVIIIDTSEKTDEQIDRELDEVLNSLFSDDE